MTDLFSPLTLRGVTLKNRIGVSPMCMYSCRDDGMPTDWHLAHLVSRAVGGAGMVMTEASAVVPEGRITPGDVGIWSEAHVAAHARIAAAVAAVGSVPAIQIAHAGRKASREAPWGSGAAKPGWTCLAPSAEAFEGFAVPKAMTEEEIGGTIAAFVEAAKRSVRAGYRIIELHGAHGYLMHQFLSPISNRRNDSWGGDFEGRTRFARDTAAAVRAAIPADMPLMLRISHSDWVEGGWTTEESVELARRLKAIGVDMIDVSSGGLDAGQKIPLGPGYQVPGAGAVKTGAGIPVAAVGMITDPAQAQAILAEGKADLILLARVLLREPYWPMRAAAELGRPDALGIPPQYDRGWNTVAKWQMDRAIAEPMHTLG
ncbi:NADH:flavin oxidoreductase/NADH oxidase [Roseomonas sp. HF4]|uniref:NADH:flavin oxidoreductase/NADH oxidase n=1 Tax=Roseomonas sp. HF4 TaxID=2562313 RepID=UPI0010C0FC05|nr:NADH:flavin oxidoreductase/NADH oxidase [Roseomonas sp. HF4]